MNLFKDNISIPAHIHHIACLMKDPARDAPLAKQEFHLALSHFQVEPDQVLEDKRMGLGVKKYPGGDRLLVFWRLHTEYYSFQIWYFPAESNRPTSFGAMNLPEPVFQLSPVGDQITSVDMVLGVQSQPPTQDDLRTSFKGPEIFSSKILNGTISLYTDFMPGIDSRVRFLVCSEDIHYLKEKAFFIVESLSFLENYHHLILFPLDEFNQNMSQIFLLEKDQVIKREEISRGLEASSPKQFKEWLILLTRSLVEVNRIGDKVRYNLASAAPYDSILSITLQDLKEVPIGDCLPLNYYITRKIRGIADGYQRLNDRIDALNKALEGTIAVLRTRVDMAMEEQNLSLLKSVDQTTKNQVLLQQTVEGLSVIVLTYYMTGLFNYFFKGISEGGYIESPYLATGLFLPVSFLIAFGLVYRVKKRLNPLNKKKKMEK
ncbi:MAG: DUF3422 family protein [Nitrospiria bacterium]